MAFCSHITERQRRESWWFFRARARERESEPLLSEILYFGSAAQEGSLMAPGKAPKGT